MNKLLLKKVEELTLYMIDKDKQVGDLKDELRAQAEQLKKMQQQIEVLSKN